MNINPPSLISAYLLARTAGAVVTLAIVLLIACPLIWSRNPGRRNRSRETLRMLITLLISRHVK
jgi:hypothetical protein